MRCLFLTSPGQSESDTGISGIIIIISEEWPEWWVSSVVAVCVAVVKQLVLMRQNVDSIGAISSIISANTIFPCSCSFHHSDHRLEALAQQFKTQKQSLTSNFKINATGKYTGQWLSINEWSSANYQPYNCDYTAAKYLIYFLIRLSSKIFAKSINKNS